MNITLVELNYYDPIAASQKTLYLTDCEGGWNSGTTFYYPYIKKNAIYGIEISDRSVGGRTRTSAGNIVLDNTEGQLEWLKDVFVDGRSLTQKNGDDLSNYASFKTRINAVMLKASFDNYEVTLYLRDDTETLDSPYWTTKYGGTNVLPDGVDGTADDLKDKYKPMNFGRIALMFPYLVNTAKLVYQVRDGEVDYIVNVFDNGAYVTRGTNYTSYADMMANPPAHGYWRAWPQGGYFRLGLQPVGEISVSFIEESHFYGNTTGRVIERILTYKGKPYVLQDIANLDAVNAASIGVVVEDGENTSNLIDRITAGAGVFWYIDALGRYRLKQFAAPSNPVWTFTENSDGTDFIVLEPIASYSNDTLYEVVLQGDINYAVQDKKTLFGSVPMDRAAWFSSATRDVTRNDLAVKAVRFLSKTNTYVCYFNGLSQVQAEASRRLDMYKVPRDVVRAGVQLTSALLDVLDIGVSINVVSPRYNYASGKLFAIIGIEYDFSDETAQLMLWG